MSTKTTFKRIALVTVAALSFGVLATAPSNAAIATAGTAPLNLAATLSASTTTVTLGDKASTTLTTSGYFSIGDTVTTTVTLKSFPTTALTADVTSALSTLAFTEVDTAVANTATTSTGKGDQEVVNSAGVAGASVDVGAWGTAAGLNSTRTTLSVTPTAVGTYVYNVKTVDTSSATGTTQTWTVIVNAPTLSSSTAFIGAVAGTLTADAAATALTASGTAATAAVAKIQTIQYRTGTTAIQDLLAKSVVVAVSGAGLLAATDGAPARGSSIVTAAGTAASNNYFLHADGRTGTSTITVTIDGVLVATKTYVFTGVLASYSVVEEKKNIGVAETGTLTATGKDSNGNAATLGTVTAVSSDVAIATVAVVGGVVTVTGVKAGTATITLMNATTAAAATVSKVVTVTILPTTAKTIAWAFDKDTYDSGEKMTLTVTATGVADGARAAFTAAPVANFNLASGSDTLVGSPVFAAGVATYTLYAPATPGKFTLTASVGLGIDTEVAIKTAATTYTASKVSLSATISNPALAAAQEATDAANEATDAGNNAKDAADQAIEAADAATIAAQDAQAAADAAKDAAEQAGQDAVDAAAEATDAANNAADIAAQAIESADAATAAAEEAAAAATAAGEMAVEAAEAAGAIAQDALDAANAATDAALSAAEAADAATAAATEAKESADAATAAVAALSTEVAKLMAALNAKITTLSNLVAKIAKKVKA